MVKADFQSHGYKTLAGGRRKTWRNGRKVKLSTLVGPISPAYLVQCLPLIPLSLYTQRLLSELGLAGQ